MAKIDITADGLQKLLSKASENFQEERDLALERYRRQDDMIQTAEDFILQGKAAVDYLKIAADRSNSILAIAKFVKDIVYKDDVKGPNNNVNTNDDLKKQIEQMLKGTE